MPTTPLRRLHLIALVGLPFFGCHSGTTRDLVNPDGQDAVGNRDATMDGDVVDDSPVDGSLGSVGGAHASMEAGIGEGGARTNNELPDAEPPIDLDADADADTNSDASARCGDGNQDVALNEECDDGNQQHSDGCELDCKQTRVEQVSVGWAFNCALSSGGGVKCWGNDAYGCLGRGTNGADIARPSQVAPLDFGTTRRVTQISTGYDHACVRFEDGKARCWGRNESGQLGINSQSDYGDEASEQLSQLADLPLGNVKSITAGRFSTCAIVGNAGSEQLYCWGSNTRGELGLASTALLDQPGPATALNALPLATIIGMRWICALLPSAARCWGGYQYGIQGIGATNQYVGDNESPNASSYDAKGLPGTLTQLSGTNQTVCALSAGDMYCWGSNVGAVAGYPVGNHGTTLWQTPGPVNLGAVSLAQISVSGAHGCAVDEAGFVRCWGSDPDDGALGYPGVGYVGVDRDPALDYESMRAASDGGISDAGDAGFVTPGLPTGAVDLGDFDGTPGPDLAIRVETGHDRSCALMHSGGIRCWGENTGGSLGYGVDVSYIGLTDSPAQAYQQLGYADVHVFGPLPSGSN
jgi:cysteine-rich repeat protein